MFFSHKIKYNTELPSKTTWFKQRLEMHSYSSCLFHSSKLILKPFAKTTNLWNNRADTRTFSPLLLGLTDVFILSFHFLNWVAVTLVAMFSIGLLASKNNGACFEYYRTFLMSLLSCESLSSLTYSKVNIHLFLYFQIKSWANESGENSYCSLSFFKNLYLLFVPNYF